MTLPNTFIPANPDEVQALIEASLFRAIGEDPVGLQEKTALAILATVRRVYLTCEPEQFLEGFIVRTRASSNAVEEAPNLDSILNSPQLAVDALPHLAQAIIIEISDAEATVSTGIWAQESNHGGVIYRYKEGVEELVINGNAVAIPNPYTTSFSAFSTPVFAILEASINHYGTNIVGPVRCSDFKLAWHDDNYILLTSNPEHFMRTSLEKHLTSSLLGAEVRPEQIIDDSHPVDIKVIFLDTNRVALIEIKWMGDSLNDSGNLTTYRDARAREGVRQITDYLVNNRVYAPTNVTHGYLVVYDCRRRGVTPSTATISNDDGFHYVAKDITWDGAEDTSVPEYMRHFRLFARPICT